MGLTRALERPVLWIRGWRKSAAERERERRLSVNEMGRITDGTLMEVEAESACSPPDSASTAP